MLLAHRDGGTFEAPIPISALKLSGVGGAAVASIQGAASSRTNAGNWVSMVGKEPLGEWTLQLPDNQDTRRSLICRSVWSARSAVSMASM